MNNIKYIINGSFLCRNLTGIERFSYEILTRLDNFPQAKHIAIFIPQNAKQLPELKNISIIKGKRSLKSYPFWTNFIYGFCLIKNHAIGIDFANTCSIFKPGIVFIHDIYCKIYKDDFHTFRDKLVRIYSCFMYRFCAKQAKKLFTVSEFSKMQISQHYGISLNKITVIPNGWDHFRNIKMDFSILENTPKLQNGFYFTLGSLSKRKNLKWILDYAKKNPDDLFAISGKPLNDLIPNELDQLKKLKNIIFLGYLTDGQVKALMSKCKAFIFPSYYEGFGIPPLEALSVGAKIIVSKAACLPEIYGNTAHYIDPNNPDVNLNQLLEQPVESPERILEKYTYDNATEQLITCLDF